MTANYESKLALNLVFGLVLGGLVWYLPAVLSIGMFWPMLVVSIPSFIIGYNADKYSVFFLLSLLTSMVFIFFIKINVIGQMIFIVALLYFFVFFTAVIFFGVGMFVRGFFKERN